jgi:hypothetical protein
VLNGFLLAYNPTDQRAILRCGYEVDGRKASASLFTLVPPQPEGYEAMPLVRFQYPVSEGLHTLHIVSESDSVVHVYFTNNTVIATG